jgi:hypothetical protein
MVAFGWLRIVLSVGRRAERMQKETEQLAAHVHREDADASAAAALP